MIGLAQEWVIILVIEIGRVLDSWSREVAFLTMPQNRKNTNIQIMVGGIALHDVTPI